MLTSYHQNNNDYQQSHYFHRLILFLFSLFRPNVFRDLFIWLLYVVHIKEVISFDFGLWMCP